MRSIPRLAQVGLSLIFCLAAASSALAAAPVITLNASPAPKVVAVASGLTLDVGISPDTSKTFTDDDDGSYTYQWMKNGLAISGATSSSFTISSAATIDTGWYQVVATNTSSQSTTSPVVFVNVDVNPALISVFGYNGDNENVVPSGLTDVVSISGGANSLAALNADGTVTAWGAGKTNTGTSPEFGQSIVPDALKSAATANVVSIAEGDFHVLALKADGTVVGWGLNTSGQTTVPTLVNPVAIAARANASYALQADGTVVAWGATGAVPDAVNNNIVAISAGFSFAAALKADGTVTAWGIDIDGATEVPSDLTNPSTANIVAIASGSFFTVALKSDGTVVAWGDNTFGETSVPTSLTSAATAHVIAISANGGFALAFKADGTVVAWGNNPDGEYTGLSGLTKVVGVSAGPRFSIVLQNTPLSITSQPAATSVTALTTATFTVAATGASPLTYQWQKGGVNLVDGLQASGATASGSTTTTLQISNAQFSDSGGTYGVAVSDSGGDTIQAFPATLTVIRIATTYALSSTSFTYTGSVQGPTINPTPSGATFTSGGTLSATTAGGYTATATATGNYTGTNSSLIWSITQASQTITFGALSGKTFGDAPLAVSATASSGLTPTFSIVSGPATVSGSTVTITGAGSVTVRASQAGNANYLAATPVDQSFSVSAEPTTFALDSTSFTYNGSLQGPNIVPTPSGATFSSGGTLTASAVGNYTATATATGNYTGSNSALNWSITKATATVTLGSLTVTFDGNPHSATATTTPSGLTVTFTYDGSSTAPSAIGSYTVVGTVNDLNYQGSASGTLTISALQYHSGDTNQDHKFSLSELLRVISLYNYSSGGVRTGQYHVQSGTVDGFAPGPGTVGPFHSADTNQDGKLSLSELLRVISLYNYSSGGSRTGQYHVQTGTVDGFAPGP